MSEKWEVVYDGDSGPMLQSPSNSLLRIQRLFNGHWGPGPFNVSDSTFFAEAANLLREKNQGERSNG